MRSNKTPITSRRDFLAKVIPGCALTCMVSNHLIASTTLNEITHQQENESKFDRKMDRYISYKQWKQNQHTKYIGILKNLEKEVGKENLLEMLKRSSYNENLEMGKQLSTRIKSLRAFVYPFRDKSSNLSTSIVHEIIEDSENAFEIKVTACVDEIVFREEQAQDLGYACVCHADFGLPEGINSNLKLIRNKTLMQGDDCCNHRYVWHK